MSVSDEDIDLLSRKLCFFNAGSTSYVFDYYGGRNRYLHREIAQRVLGRPLKKGEVVDHIDGDGTNNTRENLRVVTHRQNLQNQRHHRSGRLPGCSFSKGKWQASIRIRGKRFYLGRFSTEELAHAAYLKACSTL